MSKLIPVFFFVILPLATGIAGRPPRQTPPPSPAPAPAATPAPTPLNLTMREAVLMSLGRNFDIETESYSPLIDKARLRAASGKFDPSLRASYLHLEDTDRRVVDLLFPGNFLSATERNRQAAVNFGGLLPWGLNYNLRWSSTERDGVFGRTEELYTNDLRLDLTQPLLRDFGPGVNMASIRLARRDLAISEWALRARVIDIVTEVEYIYNDLHFARENLAVAKRSQSLARTLLGDNQRRMEIGTMSPLDVTQARADVAQREESVILAERAVRDNANYLKQLVTNDIENLLGTDIQITPPPMADGLAINVTEGIKDALQFRPDYRQTLIDLEKRKIRVVFEKNQALPRLDLVGSLGAIGADTAWGQSLSDAVDRDKDSWSAGAVFSVPIPNREGLGNARAAKLEEVKALVATKRLEQEIVVRIDNAAGQIITSRKRIDSTRESRQLAEETLDAGQERLKVGATTTFEVLELQKKLAEALVAELLAKTDFNKAVAEFDRQTGTTLQRRAIELKH